MKNFKLKIIIGICLLMAVSFHKTEAHAMLDGAYLVPVTYSYVNPDTNKTEDGSTNIALGESMIGSMLNTTALVEQTNGKTYVTIGLGMMSNVSNVKIKVQNGKGGSYSNASISKTGSSSMNGDTCNHYRFQMNNTSGYISPILYIDPMGRDVQFFIGLKMGSAKEGTGIFKSQMIPAKAEATPKPTVKPTTAPTAKPTTVPTAKPTVKPTEKTSEDQEEKATPEPTEEVKENSKTDDSEEKDSEEKKLEDKDSKVEDSEVEDSEAKDSEAKDSEAKDSNIEKEDNQTQEPTASPVIEEQSKEDAKEDQEEVTSNRNFDGLYIAIIVVSVIGSIGLLWKNGKGKHHE
ncbi:hypothetical protein lbkm_2157 [Lachnospiraceae bacterium KM106-2]|nr:hypothetical protein lbkm_2157 [Lachnospiraceae bacterium KM106-2]